MKKQILILLSVILALLCCNNSTKSDDNGIGYDPPPDESAFDLYPCWSGTHDLIAYVHYQQPHFGDPDSSGIYTIKPDGTERQLFLRADWVSRLDWSPDGNWIVANVGSELWKISYPDKTVDTLLTAGQYYNPSWSPNGNQILFVARAGDNRGIYIVSTDGSNPRLIIPYGDYSGWLYPDSILYVNYAPELPSGSLCVSDTNGVFKRIYSFNSIYEIDGFNYIRPDNVTKRIACLPIFPTLTDPNTYIWMLSFEGSEIERFFENASYPNFSPDGNRIVFTRYSRQLANLWIINWDGTGLTQLTEPLNP